MTRTQEYFQNVALGSLTVEQLNKYGELLTLEPKNIGNLQDLNKYLISYQAQHAPINGQPIPGSCLISSKTATADNDQIILAPTNQEVRGIAYIRVKNAGITPATINIKVQNMPIILEHACPPNDSIVTVPEIITIDSGLDLRFDVTTGTATDITVECLSYLRVQ